MNCPKPQARISTNLRTDVVFFLHLNYFAFALLSFEKVSTKNCCLLLPYKYLFKLKIKHKITIFFITLYNTHGPYINVNWMIKILFYPTIIFLKTSSSGMFEQKHPGLSLISVLCKKIVNSIG